MFRHRYIAPVPALVSEGDDEDKVETADREDEPEDDTPLSGTSDDEIAEEGAAVWGKKEKRSPETNLAGVLVEEKHVFDVRETDRLAGCQGEAHHGTQAVEGGETGGKGAAEGEKRASDLRPEENGSAAPFHRVSRSYMGAEGGITHRSR